MLINNIYIYIYPPDSCVRQKIHCNLVYKDTTGITNHMIPKRYFNTGRHAGIAACGSCLLFKMIHLTNKKKLLVCCQVIQSRHIATGAVCCSASLRQSFRLPSQHNEPLSVPHFARESFSKVHTIMSLVEIAVGFKRQRVNRD